MRPRKTQCDGRNENEFPEDFVVISGGQRCALLSASVVFLNLIDEYSLAFRIQTMVCGECADK